MGNGMGHGTSLEARLEAWSMEEVACEAPVPLPGSYGKGAFFDARTFSYE